jgi:hypothetical protein
MSTILCLIAGLLIFICCWFAAYIYEEDVTECSGAIDYVPASVARQLETELAAMKARAEKEEAELIDQTKRFHKEIVRRQGTVQANHELNVKYQDHILDLLAIERARLDWMQKNGHFGYKAGTVWSDYFSVDLRGGEKTTLRAAIDAAIKDDSK